MRLTKIYTRTGDGGSTMLASGDKVSKASPIIDAYGTVDELNAYIGVLRDFLSPEIASHPAVKSISESLLRIQNELFDVGAELATPSDKLNLSRQNVISHQDVKQLEDEIDFMNETLPPLKNFVLPGGLAANSMAHVARTVCRRAERCLVKSQESGITIRKDVQIYMNRLSDWLFVCARFVSLSKGLPEVLWEQRKPKARE